MTMPADEILAELAPACDAFRAVHQAALARGVASEDLAAAIIEALGSIIAGFVACTPRQADYSAAAAAAWLKDEAGKVACAKLQQEGEAKP